MNALSKWASMNSAETCVNGKKTRERVHENVALKLMTSSNSTPRSNENVEFESTNGVVSSNAHKTGGGVIQKNFLSHVPVSTSAHVIPCVGSETHRPSFPVETRANGAVDGAESPITTKSLDTKARKKRFAMLSAITTNSDDDALVSTRHCGSANASPSSTTPSTPAESGRFKFPAVKMGGFFRKKCSWPTLHTSMNSTSCDSADRSPSPSRARRRQKKIAKDSPKNSPVIYNNVGGGAANANETSPLLRRINNRLQLQRASRFPRYHYRQSCYCLEDCYHRHELAKRRASREDPGPRTEANEFTMLTEAIASSETDELVDGGNCAGASGVCNKSASYPTAFSSMGWLGAEGGDVGANCANGGTKYKLVNEAQVQVCRLNHARTLLGKLTSSKLLRRWETHTLILDAEEITSKTPHGFMDQPIRYSLMEDVHPLPPWDSCSDKHCVRIFVPEGSVLLQSSHVYARNQWFYSIQWQRSMYRYHRVIESNCNRPEVLLKEIKCMVEQTMRTPLQGDHMNLNPVRLVCIVLSQIADGHLPKTMVDPLLICVAPLLDTIAAVSEISPFLTKFCEENPRSRIIDDVLTEVAHLTLKKNMDFGKHVSARLFVQEFLLALNCQNGGLERVKAFVRSAHGPSSACPHPRMLPNFVSVCLAAIHALFDSPYGGSGTKASSSPSTSKQEKLPQQQQFIRLTMKRSVNSALAGDTSSLSSGSMSSDDRFGPVAGAQTNNAVDSNVSSSLSMISASSSVAGDFLQATLLDQSKLEAQSIIENRLPCFCAVFETISEFDDWRVPFASLLQPIPFPEEVLTKECFSRPFGRLIKRIGTDPRCEVHLSVLGVREGKEGWFHLVCPGGPTCSDDGDLLASLLKTLLRCCCRRKKFLQSLNPMLGPLQLLSLRECEPALDALCGMLELEVVEGEDLKLQVITALQSTPAGKRQYSALCDRQTALRELQQKGGPRKLTLPSKSTDADLAVLLSSGSFGNLEWLSLAFTNVTSVCAEYLIKLPSLRYLNLWSTQFGDVGLQTITEHLHRLQVLNLCETPVTDKGLAALTSLSNLRKLNLNSTQLSAKTFQLLRAKLPSLQEVDVRYTDAWCADDVLGS